MSFSKKTLPPLLTIISCIGLVLFLGYWLWSSYNEEKELLSQQLEYHMNAANDALDNNILYSYLKQATSESGDTLVIRSDSSGDTQASEIKFYNFKVSGDSTLMPEVISENVSHPMHEIASIERNDSLDQSLTEFRIDTSINHQPFKREVSITFQNGDDTDLNVIELTEQDAAVRNPDLRREYMSRVENLGLPTTFEIIDSKDSTLLDVERIEFMVDKPSFFSPDFKLIRFNSYSNYLLKKIVPNMLFGVLLLGVIGITFFLLMKNVKNQERLSKLKSDFIGNMTHELKTPIATVGVAIEALQSFGALEDKKKREEYLDISKHELNRLSILVNKVLKLSLIHI